MKDLERTLACYTVPPPQPQAVERTAACLQAARTARTPHISDITFLRQQLGFIHRRMWVLQGAFLAVLVAWAVGMAARGMAPERLYPVYAAAAPLLVLINITDWVRIYNGGMLELELATRFSLPRVAAARMLLFGLSDAALLLALAAITAATTRSGLLALLVQVLTPFNAMCVGCLWLLRRARPQRFAAGSVLLAIALAGTVLLVDRLRVPLPAATGTLALALTAAALAWQGRAVFRSERGTLDAAAVL